MKMGCTAGPSLGIVNGTKSKIRVVHMGPHHFWGPTIQGTHFLYEWVVHGAPTGPGELSAPTFTKSFSERGDSGSFVVTPDGSVIGLLWGND